MDISTVFLTSWGHPVGSMTWSGSAHFQILTPAQSGELWSGVVTKAGVFSLIASGIIKTCAFILVTPDGACAGICHHDDHPGFYHRHPFEGWINISPLAASFRSTI
jgi:hypothetical protein